ncbi:MAG: NAD-dependent epimerase/dehydratase family protein [Chloroflexota bacterium]|nr:NAD-dependent epimerase/dehydratase family protein [Chloroflexota bacterium]
MTQRILVTGGAGFIGSHVVEALRARGDEPHVMDDLSKGQVSNLPVDVPLYVLDMAASPLGRLFGIPFDAVVHCAAQTNVMRSLADPVLDRRINVDGLERVLDGALASGVRRFVFISSGGAVYGETPVPASEATQPRPENPYGRHKLEGEAMVAAAPISSVSLRLSNVYGPRQRSDAEGGVASIFSERLAAGLPLRIYGDGEQQRDFVHVADVASAILLALDDDTMTGVWNVGTGTPTSVNELAALMVEASGEHTLIERLPARGEIRRSCLDVAKLRGTGRWAPEHVLRQGVIELLRSAAQVHAL